MRNRTLILVCELLLLNALGAGASNAGAQSAAPGVPRLTDLALAWSGGQTHPNCQDRGPHREHLALPGDQYCVWPAAAGSAAKGQVSAYTHKGWPETLSWDRQASGVDDADRFADSLGKALTSLGLRARKCLSGNVPAGYMEETHWESATLVVALIRVTPRAGNPTLKVWAVDNPRNMPGALCPPS